MASSISSSSSDEDYKSNDCTTNLEGPKSDNEAISTYSNDESDKDKEFSNEAFPRCITHSSTRVATLFTNAPNPNSIDDELLKLHATICSRSYLLDPPFEPLLH